MPDTPKSRRHRVGLPTGEIELAQRPIHHGRLDHCRDTDIHAESEGKIVILLVLKDRQRLLKMSACIVKLPRE